MQSFLIFSSIWQKFLKLETFWFFFFEVLKVLNMSNNYFSISEVHCNKNKAISINSCYLWPLLLSFSQKAVMNYFSASFVDLRLVLTPIKSNPDYFLLLIPSLVNFLSIPQICSAERIRGIGGNFSNLEDFLFWNRKGTT